MMRLKYLFVFVIILMFVNACNQEKETNWHLTFDRLSKEPYGCFLAYNHLKSIFPDAEIQSSGNLVAKLKKLNQSNEEKLSLAVFVSNSLFFDSIDYEVINTFVANGNSVLILSNNLNDASLKYFEKQVNESYSSLSFNEDFILDGKKEFDFISIQDSNQSSRFSYFKKAFNSYFIDTSQKTFKADVGNIGFCNNAQKPNLYEWNAAGNLIVGLTPLALTNHFMLQDSNRKYFERLFSKYSIYTNHVYWQSDFNMYSNESDDDSIFSLPPFFKAFVVIMLLFLIFAFFEGKRRQRIIPERPPLQNDTLEFVETIGRLYYNKQDHKNLSDKMIAYYLEHLRSHHNLKTQILNDEFAMQLTLKLNQPHQDTKSFITYLNYIRNQPQLSEKDIKQLYETLKKFM